MWELTLVTGCGSGVGDRKLQVLVSGSLIDYGISVGNVTAMASVSLDEDIDKILDSWLVDALANDANAP